MQCLQFFGSQFLALQIKELATDQLHFLLKGCFYLLPEFCIADEVAIIGSRLCPYTKSTYKCSTYC